MSEIEILRRLYDAFDARDAGAILNLLHPDFVGEVTPGLPGDWGGTYRGPERMLSECWGPAFAVLDTRPVPEDMVATEDGRVLVLGTYRGSARDTGHPHEARFAHILRFADGKVAGLVQITDSARWHEAVRV